MAGLVFPDVGVFLSGADPNDPNTVELWSSNLAPPRTWRINNASRGRQYEQDQNIEGSANLDWRNVDEWLNPANSSSPLLLYAKPMRRIRMMYSYPPAGTGNLANTIAGIDPTVDSYPTGKPAPWQTNVGGVNGLVTAANPHSGANSVQYTVAGSSTPQGEQTVPLPFFPGNQYTASWFVSQTSASTQQIAVGGLTALDRFPRTGALNASTSETGQTWTVAGGVAGDYTTTAGPNPPGIGAIQISNNTLGVGRFATLGVTAQDYDARIRFTAPALATGDFYWLAMVGRFANSSNYYRYELGFRTDGLVEAKLYKVVAGTQTQLGSTATALFNYAAGTKVWLRAQAAGTTLSLTTWLDGTVMPTSPTLTLTDATYTAAGQIGVQDVVGAASTNGTLVVSQGPMAVTSYSTPGTTTAATGAYQRLTVTFTATQPTHTFQVTTIGTAVAGTVNADDFQVEPGGTANAFTTTGPLIRGMWGGHVQDLPVTWVPGSQGFEGMVSAPSSGPFAALGQVGIHTDYITSVLRKVPAYYWPLWDPQGATNFAEISGNAAPPMRRFDLQTPATAFSPGSPNSIPGDPSGVGLTFAGQITSSGSDVEAGPSTAIAVGSNGPTWALTMSCWMSSTGTDDLVMFQLANAAGQAPAAGFYGPHSVQFQVVYGAAAITASVAKAFTDGKPHHFVATVVVASNTMTVTLYADGQNVNVASGGYTATFGANPAFLMNWAMCAGQGFAAQATSIVSAAGANGTYSHLAVWTRALSAAEVTDLYNAGSGNQGELSGTRVARYLGNYYTGPSVVDPAPLSYMGPPTAPESTTLLQALQRIQDTEAGNLFETRDGAVQFDGREIRWQRLTPTVVFGDGPGEIPYEEAPVYGYGLTQTNNQALISRSGGIRAVATPDTTGSINSFFPRGFSLQVDSLTDFEAQQHANWVVLTRGQPQQRVSRIRINLGANPSAFPTIMNLEIGSRVTQNRRPKAANSGAGITMSGGFFIEKITHSQIDPELGTWFVDLEMSPVPTPQPWIVGDPVFGKVGVTTRPGW